jgi:hypothetical protein
VELALGVEPSHHERGEGAPAGSERSGGSDDLEVPDEDRVRA